MLVRSRDIGYYRKKDDRSSLHSLLDKFNCPSTSNPPLRQRDAFLRLELSVDHRLPAKNYTPSSWCLEICYVLSQNNRISHFQVLSFTLRYTVLKIIFSFAMSIFHKWLPNIQIFRLLKNYTIIFLRLFIFTIIYYLLVNIFSIANISRRYRGHRGAMTAETLNKQNPWKCVICISLIAQDCNTWVWSKERARDGVGYPEDLYHRTVFHRLPVITRTHIHSRLVHRPSTPSIMPSNRDPRGCLDLTPVKILLIKNKNSEEILL